MKLAATLMAAAFTVATFGVISGPSLAATKSVTTRSNGACTTRTVKVREHGVMRTRTMRSCAPAVRVAPVVRVAPRVVAPRVVVRTPVVRTGVVVRSPMHRCVTKTVIERGMRRTRRVCG